MRIVFGLVLLVGIALAGFAVYMARGYVETYQAQLAAERQMRDQIVPTTEVYVLNEALRYGQRLTKENVRLVRWPVDAIPEGAFTTEDSLFPPGVTALRSVTRAMDKGEAVLSTKVTEPGEDAGVGARLAAGMRAFALRVDVASGVSGFVRPGDRVDVYWTGSPPGGEGGEITKLIDANVRIIAIDQTADEDQNSPLVARTVTVEATPQQVAALAQAQAIPRSPRSSRSTSASFSGSSGGWWSSRKSARSARAAAARSWKSRSSAPTDLIRTCIERTPHLGCVPLSAPQLSWGVATCPQQLRHGTS
jgi:pilus assembly protein CpaB